MKNPKFRIKSKKEIAIPNPTNIKVCGIFILDEVRAAANIMAKNIGIAYWDVRNICPPPPPPLEGAIDDSIA